MFNVFLSAVGFLLVAEAETPTQRTIAGVLAGVGLSRVLAEEEA